jgi:hypothetical protein
MPVRRTKALIAFIVFIEWFIPEVSLGSFKYDSRGRRDPFMPLLGQQRQLVTLDDVVSVDDVTLEGIAVERQGKKVAIINGVMLKEGDKAGSIEVKRISEEGATVIIDGREYKLTLPEVGK